MEAKECHSLGEQVVKDLLTELFKGHNDPLISGNSTHYALCFLDFLQQSIKSQLSDVSQMPAFMSTKTEGYGFINEFNTHDNLHYFVKASLITGKRAENSATVNRYQYLSLLCGHRIKKLAAHCTENHVNPYQGVLLKLNITGLHFSAKPSKDINKAYIDNEGILENIKF